MCAGLVSRLGRLRVLGSPAGRKSGRKNSRFFHMEGLVHDLNVALELDEAANTSSANTNNSAGPSTGRRRVWRRRCKSTSNLAALSGEKKSSAGEKKGNKSLVLRNNNNSDDSSSSTTTDNFPVVLAADRGTSSLQLTDSDEDKPGKLSSNCSYSTRRKPSYEIDPHDVMTATSGAKKSVESDSVNENISPVRPNTKRKRKFKRMALDPDNSSVIGSGSAGKTGDGGSDRSEVKNHPRTGTLKRKKVRSRSVCEAANKSASVAVAKPAANKGGRQRQLSATVIPGKRKRSSREKSVEPDNSHFPFVSQQSRPSHSSISEEPPNPADSMECDDDDDRRSSSSLSSTDWEDNDVIDVGNPNNAEDDGEADDEQSDWPGHESVFGEDDEMSTSTADIPVSAKMFPAEIVGHMADLENFSGLTSTARTANLARMKRLADCVPGREIRAGSRKLRNPQTGFTIKSSSSEQLSRFLQDPGRTELKLAVLRPADRDKIAQMANLYSLRLRYDGPNMLVLTKTGKTVKVDCFIVPKTPAKTHVPVDVKRRRRTPPPDPGHANDEKNLHDEERLRDSAALRRQSN